MKNFYVKLITKTQAWNYNQKYETKRVIITAHNEEEVKAIIICFYEDMKIEEIAEFTPEVAKDICHPADKNKIKNFQKKGVDKSQSLCYNIITVREGKPIKPSGY